MHPDVMRELADQRGRRGQIRTLERTDGERSRCDDLDPGGVTRAAPPIRESLRHVGHGVAQASRRDRRAPCRIRARRRK